jgi:hypothetical protein
MDSTDVRFHQIRRELIDVHTAKHDALKAQLYEKAVVLHGKEKELMAEVEAINEAYRTKKKLTDGNKEITDSQGDRKMEG